MSTPQQFLRSAVQRHRQCLQHAVHVTGLLRELEAFAGEWQGPVLPKPFRTEELLARLRVTRGGVPINLAPLEYRAFAYLARHRGRVVSQAELSEQVYAQDWGKESNAIQALILRIRRKRGAPVIETRRGFGYIVAGS